MPNNIYQNSIRPVTPQVLNSERITVYVPEASNTTKGIANYTDDFIVLQGTVKFNTTKYNDPFNKLSFVKLNSDDFEKNNSDFIQIKWPFAYDKSGSARANGFGLMKIRDNSADYLKFDENGNLALDYDKLANTLGSNVSIEAHNNDPVSHPYILNLLDDKVNKRSESGLFNIDINDSGITLAEFITGGTPSHITVKPNDFELFGQNRVFNGGNIATQEDLNTKISELNSVQIRNKEPNLIITATTNTVQAVATQYIVDNYGRQPETNDGLFITMTDKNNDVIEYAYFNSSWINIGLNDIDLSNYIAKDDITNINLTYGQETLIYDTTDGMTINAQGQIKFKDNTVHSFNSEFNVPIIAADDSITIDVDEANQKFRIKANGKIDVDNQTITKNSANELQTIGVKYNDNLITAEMIYNATHYIRYKEDEPTPPTPVKEAGLYVNGVLSKTWAQLIADGDVTITNGALKVANTSLAGDLICDNVEGLTGLQGAFAQCTRLTSIDTSKLDTSNVTTMFNMFAECIGLTSLDVSNFDTSKVTSMTSVFAACSSLTSLNLSNFNTINVTKMSQMFGYCASLTSLDISNFTFDKVISYTYMFDDVPNNCEILVKSQTEKDWITSKFTNLTNVKIKGTV